MIQVGGGALASACIQAFAAIRAAGAIDSLPRFDTVQTRGAFPLRRAFERIRERVAARASDAGAIDAELCHARTHRSAFMQPWETEPRSVAHGILDDETYDWAAVTEGMLSTGGVPLVASEDELREANRVARATTGIDVDHTGSAGLAGLMQTLTRNPAARGEQLAVIFSGIDRSTTAAPPESM